VEEVVIDVSPRFVEPMTVCLVVSTRLMQCSISGARVLNFRGRCIPGIAGFSHGRRKGPPYSLGVGMRIRRCQRLNAGRTSLAGAGFRLPMRAVDLDNLDVMAREIEVLEVADIDRV